MSNPSDPLLVPDPPLEPSIPSSKEEDIDEAWLLVGRINAPIGVRGEVRIEPYTEFPRRFKKATTIYVGPKRQPYAILNARQHSRGIVLQLEGVTTPEQAGKLRLALLWVPRTEAIPLPAGRYYHSDIMGLTVTTTDGSILGKITEVLETGSNDVYVAQNADGEVLIPALRSVVVSIDITAGVMTIDPPPGLL